MPLSCAAPRARAIWAAIRIERSGGNGAASLIAFDSVAPSTYSITEYVMPSGVVRRSVTSTMFGCADHATGLRLLHEALDRRGVAHHLALEHLDRERPLDHGVARGIHHAHPALADLALDEVAAVERLADEPVVLAVLIAQRVDRRGARPRRRVSTIRLPPPASGTSVSGSFIVSGPLCAGMHLPTRSWASDVELELDQLLTVERAESGLAERALTRRARERHGLSRVSPYNELSSYYA